MLYKRQDLPELYHIKHLHDTNNQFVDYENQILTSTLSPFMFNNDTMNSWLDQMQPLVSILFDQMNVMKNFQNYNLDKYDYRHNK